MPFPGDWHLLKNYQIALMKPYFDAGLKSLAEASGYPSVAIRNCTQFKRTHFFILESWEAIYLEGASAPFFSSGDALSEGIFFAGVKFFRFWPKIIVQCFPQISLRTGNSSLEDATELKSVQFCSSGDALSDSNFFLFWCKIIIMAKVPLILIQAYTQYYTVIYMPLYNYRSSAYVNWCD